MTTWPTYDGDPNNPKLKSTIWGCKKAKGTFFVDDTDDWITADPTECFIGNELYSTEMVFCDQKHLSNNCALGSHSYAVLCKQLLNPPA